MLNDDKHQDAMMDQNLRAIAAHATRPAEPTAEQVARWKRPADEAIRPSREGARLMRRRIFSWSGVGTALAATIVLGVFMWTPGGRGQHSQVKADEIFAGLRDALSNAFKVTFTNLSDGNMQASGTILVKRFDGGTSGTTTASSEGEEGAFIDLHVAGVEGTDSAGLNGDAKLCFMPGSHWAYVKAQNVPESVRESHALFGWLADRSQDGLFIRIPEGGAMTLGGTPSGTTTDENGVTTTVTTTVTAEAAPPVEAKKTFSISLGGSAGGLQAGVHTDPRVQAAVEEATAEQNGSGFAFKIVGDNPQQQEILQRLLTGHASAADINELVTNIQQSAGHVSIAQTEPGLHVLTASEFIVSQTPGGEADDAVLRIAYREGQGVQWAEVDKLGPSDGLVRFERTDVADNDPRFEGGAYENDATVRKLGVLDWLALYSLLQASGEANANGAAGN